MIVVAQVNTDEEAKEIAYIRKICMIGNRARLLASKTNEE